ncbi:MAG: SAM-dependent methyltransferase [Gammaproteobacteria bacterium]|nr:SAM-dependent methyltransferase [Gammaproteobacteria bacterium]
MQRTYSDPWKDYQLIDVGDNHKLERWGEIVTIRPDRNAYFQSVLSKDEWYDKAHFEFVETTKSSGTWKHLKPNLITDWQIDFNNIKINLHLTKFKHLGIFPEQRVNWDYLSKNLNEGDRFLNLFGYTGIASLVAKQKAADVFHCDSVKQVISWGNENMLASGLSDIHWILEDALKYAKREVKRGHQFKGIIMDPPAFGIGAKKQRWKIENKFPELLAAALDLKEDGGFIIANTYSPRLNVDKINKIAKELTSNKKINVTTLSVNSETQKRLDYGQRTLITD